MKRNYGFIWLTLIAVVLLLVAACAPKAIPVPPSTPSAPQAATAIPVSAAPPVGPEEAAWAKVVEAAKKEGKVNAYSYCWIGDVGLAISKAFKEKYGISIEIITGRGSEFLERLKTEKRMGRQVGDVTDGSVVHINNMKLEGLLASVAGELPALRERGVWWVEPTAIDPQDKANLVWRLIIYTPYINTKLVKPEDVPKSWKDLLEPKWKGKMSLTDPSLGSHVAEWYVALSESKVLDEDYIRALYKQNPRFYVGLYQEFQALARGETHLQIVGSDVTAASVVLEGAPIQAIDMKEGVLVTVSSAAAIAGGPNPNAARVLLNWIFSQEGIAIAGKAMGNRMVRKDIPDFRPKAIQSPITNPIEEKIEYIEKATRLFRERWFDKVVGR